ncbi:MAG: hypothetical protein ACLF0P_12000 [Thermoanaerobaculia bacterium]
MRNETKGSRAAGPATGHEIDGRTGEARRPRTAPANAFTRGFLLKAARLEDLPSSAGPAVAGGGFWAGPWELEPVEVPHGGLWAVARRGEPVAAGHEPAAYARNRADAALVAAMLPALAAPSRIRLGEKAKRLGFPVHDGDVCIGHLAAGAGREPRIAEQLHAVRTVLRHPECLALPVQSLGGEALPVLGRALMRRIETV